MRELEDVQHFRLDAIADDEDTLAFTFPGMTPTRVIGWEEEGHGPVLALHGVCHATVTAEGAIRPTRGRLAYWPASEDTADLACASDASDRALARSERLAEAA